jgi:GrpB-like predicted nucleotidyltransferase (UPF0157 family)
MAIVLVPHDPRWPLLAEEERRRLLDAARGLLVAVEHVGSTAVAGLVAKPVLDLLGGVARLADADEAAPGLAVLGYARALEHDRAIPERRYFRKGAPGARTHHLHVVVHGGAFWREHVAFRDRLRADPSLAVAYAALKRDLASRFASDAEAYTAGKSDFVARALRSAPAGTRTP